MMKRCQDCGAWDTDCEMQRDGTGNKDCWHPKGTLLVWSEKEIGQWVEYGKGSQEDNKG